jgi:ribosomal protein S10
MVKKNTSFFSITVFHHKEISRFLNQIFLFFRKYKLNLQYYKKKEKKSKNTILRSPHVNKTARDQIEIYSSEFFFKAQDEPNLIQFFLFILKKYSLFSLKFKYQKIKKQTIFLTFFNV